MYGRLNGPMIKNPIVPKAVKNLQVSHTSDLRVSDAQCWVEWTGAAKPANAAVVAVCEV